MEHIAEYFYPYDEKQELLKGDTVVIGLGGKLALLTYGLAKKKHEHKFLYDGCCSIDTLR